MRTSNLFGETLKELPSSVEAESHQLLLRAGYVRQLAAGIFSALPLAWRSLRKIEQVLREEMDRIGGQELNMPVVHPSDVWKESGRWDVIGPEMVRFKDRKDRDMLLAMTHEEVVGALAKSEVRSYKQLPILVYQMQTKFRDEPRARGGLIRVREFVMKDSYSLDRDQAGLEQQYREHYHSYFRIGKRLGLPLVAVKSDSGMMGGKVAHEFMYVTDIGEDSLALCGSCGYSANREVADFRYPSPKAAPEAPIERVETPGAKTIEKLVEQLGIEAADVCKCVVYAADQPDGSAKLVLALVRADFDVNPVAVQNLAKVGELRSAEPAEIVAAGGIPGFVSPIGLDRDEVVIVADELVAKSSALVAGANEKPYHLKNTQCGRDYQPHHTGRIAGAADGLGCPECGQPLRMGRGIEVGNIFQLGTRYSDSMGALFADEDGSLKPLIMGSYGIGVGRMLACIAEENRDGRGLMWPMSVAPFQVCLVSMGREPETHERAEELYRSLQAAGLEVLFEDRDAGPGEKLATADLRGIPLRAILSERSLKNGGAEVKHRREEEGQIVPLEELAVFLKERVAAELAGLDAGLDELPRLSE
jgi:prolyl-tRNA synthetase